MKIIFVRHGESEHNANRSADKDTPLTEKGRRQASVLAKRLKKYRISEIYTSNLLRAKETGEIISKTIGVPIRESLSDLDEYDGEYFNKSFRKFVDRQTRKRLVRMRNFLDEISRERMDDKIILIVAHGVTNRIIMGHFADLPIKKVLLRFNQENTCMNILQWKEEFHNWRVNCINDIEHLSLALRFEESLRK